MPYKKNFVESFIKGFLDFFVDLGAAIGGAFVSAGKGIGNFFVTFVSRFKNGNAATKISHVIMGFGNFYHKQFAKGFIYLLLQADSSC